MNGKPLFLFDRHSLCLLLLLLIVGATTPLQLHAQGSSRTITGVVFDDAGFTVPGATVMENGTQNGTVTDFDGNFTINVSSKSKSLSVSFVGYETSEVTLGKSNMLKVVLSESSLALEEVIVVGYGTQKKETVVGAITQASGEELQRTGGVTNVSQALTGLLPGVSTIQTSSRPGSDDATIYIRGQSTWNNASPLVLVDGIEREMSDVDMNTVESISVLKDASATAVFGVKGAEGVILITTKRGKEGKAEFNFTSNVSAKFLARMAEKLDSYDSYMYQNAGIEREVAAFENSWQYYTPQEIVDRYRYPLTDSDQYTYPNVDWTDAMTKDYALSQNYNLNVRGGTDFVKYFASLSYTEEGDILDAGDQSNLNYTSQYSYESYNFRTNLDFAITPTTEFSVNLAGNMGVQHGTNVDSESDLWAAFYTTPSGVFPVQHEDGSWGYTILNTQITNPVRQLSAAGSSKDITTAITTDFVLKQKLDFLLEGLSANVSFSYDNSQYSSSGVDGSSQLSKYIDPYTGAESYVPSSGANEFDYVFTPDTYDYETVDEDYTMRRLFYQFQLNYNRQFDDHTLGLTALMNREEYAYGEMFPRYREDWVGRITYSYLERYLFETNAAYNGSEKFGEGYRFGFFPSVALGWVLSNEDFLSYDWLDKLKVRYSIGKIGNDDFDAERWAYETQWAQASDVTYFGSNYSQSIYTQYTETVVGNPDLQWETAVKQNLGIEVAVLKNLLSVNLDFFTDDRDNIFVSAGDRSVADYFGASAVSANIGQTYTYGMELEVMLHKNFGKDWHVWGSYSYTYAKDEITYKEDPELLADYLKSEGYSIGQTTTLLTEGYINSWDDLYASTKLQSDNAYRLPGDTYIVDFNGDGEINSYDSAPYGYSKVPQCTYNITGGFDYKAFSFMIQFYGAYNVTQAYNFNTSTGLSTAPLVFEYLNDYWTADNTDATWSAPRSSTSTTIGSLNLFDGSYLRLKNIEVAYTLRGQWLDKLGVNSLKLSASGNNLGYWSDLPEDREQNVSNTSSSSDLYPNLKRVNFGLNINF